MRQIGILAAGYALDHHVERLAKDHANAIRLAEVLAELQDAVDPGEVETNMVFAVFPKVRPRRFRASQGFGILINLDTTYSSGDTS